MKIIKYLLLLILLGLIGLSVYIATQNGKYTISRSVFIKVPKEVIFNYVNDYRNWDQWMEFDAESDAIKFDFPENTIGKGGSFSWINGSEIGKFQTLFVKENDSISQKISLGSTTSASALTLKDSLGGTKLNWIVTGTADFKTKIKAVFNGGVELFISKKYQNSLNNINKLITKEIKNFSVDIVGEVKIDSTYYVKQTVTVSTKDMDAKITTLMLKMDKFFKNGNVRMNGKPFVIYESKDASNSTVTLSVCGPLKEEIFVSTPSDVEIAKLQPFTALKTVLKGHYSHRNEAVKKAIAYISEKKINQNLALKMIDVYSVQASDVKSPSKWVTELLIPIQPNVVAAPRVVVAPELIVEDAVIE